MTPVLDGVRRNGRPVAWTPEFMGFGNHALAWFWAWRGSVHGQERRVLRTAAMEPWLDLFPAARALTLDRADVRFTDARPTPWSIPSDRDAPPFQQDWTPGELDGFVHDVLLSPAFIDLLRAHESGDDTLVVNVRRGDYYAPEHIVQWGFDINGFLSVAVPRALAQAPARRIHVVSDGMDWCREHLGWMAEHVEDLTWADPNDTPAQDFACISGATRLVVTNSTFSYWGGYVGGVRLGDSHEVWAPAFFNREQNAGRSWLLLDGWQVVDELPGGWDL